MELRQCLRDLQILHIDPYGITVLYLPNAVPLGQKYLNVSLYRFVDLRLSRKSSSSLVESRPTL